MQNISTYKNHYGTFLKRKMKKYEIEYVTKRICESNWHKEIPLKQFEKCPICKSTAYHRVVILKRIVKIIEE